MHIKKLKILAFFIVIGLTLTAPLKTLAQDTTPSLADIVLELYKHKDKNISLGSMILSGGMADDQRLLEYLHDSLTEHNTPLERTIKLYAIYSLEPGNDELKAFIESYPTNQQDFNELLNFECSVTQCPPSYMLSVIMSVADGQKEYGTQKRNELGKLAAEKLVQVYPLTDGWVADVVGSWLRNNSDHD